MLIGVRKHCRTPCCYIQCNKLLKESDSLSYICDYMTYTNLAVHRSHLDSPFLHHKASPLVYSVLQLYTRTFVAYKFQVLNQNIQNYFYKF